MNRSIFQIWKLSKNCKKITSMTVFYKASIVEKSLTIYESELCCNHSFDKPNNLKEIYNAWDVFINWSINSGNSHIAITINIPNNKFHQEDLNNYSNILKMHPITMNSKKYDDYTSLKDFLFFDPSLMCFYFREIFYYNKLLTWQFTTTEENKQGVLHLHGIIAYRNIMDYNKHIINNISNKLKNEYKDCDILLKPLNTFKEIKGWIQYLHKNKTFIFPPHFEIIEKYINVEQLNWFKTVYVRNYNLRNGFKLNETDHWSTVRDSIDLDILGCFWRLDDMYLNLSGINLNKNEINENIFIDLILNYLNIKNYFIFNDNVYSQIENTLISYVKIGSIKKVLFDDFETNIIPFFTKHFPCQFDNFDFYYIIKTYKNKMESNILKIKNLTTNKIKLNFSYMEFTDGIYDIENNNFIKKNEFINNNDICTTKYYEKSYGHIRQTKPKIWIRGIMHALGKEKISDFITICVFIASLFKQNSNNTKKKFIYVHGKTNTGKTTYLTKVLTRYFGPENIGTIVSSVDFKFQDLQDKLLVVMDEFRYSSNLSSDFLKLLGGEPLLTNQKYAKDHVLIQGLMGLILSNYLFYEKDINTRQALLERLHIIEFFQTIDKNLINIEDINKALSNEEPNIIIFCNKLYFSYRNNKSKYKNKFKHIEPTNRTQINSVALNHINKKTIYFKYYETSKWTYKPNNLLNIENNYYFKIKMNKHWCSKFNIYDNNVNNFNFFKYTYLTWNTNLHEIETSEKLGTIFYKNETKKQLINFNYQIYTTIETDKLFTKSTKLQELEKANIFHEFLLKSNKIPIIEEKLSKGFEFFNQCCNYTQEFNRCYQMLLIEYGDHAKIIAKVVLHKYGF